MSKITKEDPDAFNKIRNHLNQFKSKPQFKMRSINNEKFGIPIQTEKGWAVEKPMSYTNFMFKGDNALIKTALNKTKFLNTYFTFATDNQGDLLIEGKEVKETTAPATTDDKTDIERLQNIKGTLRVDLGGFSIDNLSEEAYDNLLHATSDPFYKGFKEWIFKYRKTQKPFAVVDSSEIIDKYFAELTALGQKEESKITRVPSEVTEKENECNNSSNNPNNINSKSFDIFGKID
jgi:hypothetical protein